MSADVELHGWLRTTPLRGRLVHVATSVLWSEKPPVAGVFLAEVIPLCEYGWRGDWLAYSLDLPVDYEPAAPRTTGGPVTCSRCVSRLQSAIETLQALLEGRR